MVHLTFVFTFHNLALKVLSIRGIIVITEVVQCYEI